MLIKKRKPVRIYHLDIKRLPMELEESIVHQEACMSDKDNLKVNQDEIHEVLIQTSESYGIEALESATRLLRQDLLAHSETASISEAAMQQMPALLRKKIEKFKEYLKYYFSQMDAYIIPTGHDLGNEIHKWKTVNCRISPEDLLENEELAIFYPAVLVGAQAVTTSAELVEDDIDNQRFHATALMNGTLRHSRRQSLVLQTNRLVCPLDPLNKEFFLMEWVETCLVNEDCSCNEDINRLLGRSRSTPVRKADKRLALSQIWEAQRRDSLESNDLQNGVWDGYETLALIAFTHSVVDKLRRIGIGLCYKHLMVVWFGAMDKCYDMGDDRRDYFLDPRQEATWQRLTLFAETLRDLDTDKLHSETSRGHTTVQEWMIGSGLSIIYGETKEWWTKLGITKPSFDYDIKTDSSLEIFSYSEWMDREQCWEQIMMDIQGFEQGYRIASMYECRLEKTLGILRDD